MDKDLIINNTLGTYVENNDGFQGIKRLMVFMFFEDVNMLLPIETEYDEAMSIIEIEEFNQLCLRIKKLRERTDYLMDVISLSDEKISALESILKEVSAIEVI